MSGERLDPRLTGRIGGLTSWARHGADVLVGPARRGFRRRFERIVDPDGTLDPADRAARAERAMRAHMLRLAALSAKARRAKGPAAPGAASRPWRRSSQR